MTLDEAIEILEITEDIDTISVDKLQEKRKRAMTRWHPDKVQDPIVKERYERQFKKIDQAVELIYEYRTSNRYAGQTFTDPKAEAFSSKREESLRAEAPAWKAQIEKVWAAIKSAGWNMTIKERVLSDGFKLKDVLDQDVKDDIMAYAVSSFVYGIYAFIMTLIPALFFPMLLVITVPVLLVHTALCFLMMLPLSRLWMPSWLNTAAWFACDKGLAVGDFIMRSLGGFRLFRVLVNWPYYFSKGTTLLVVRPIYSAIGHFLRDKVVGLKTTVERYFIDYPEHYVDQLLGKDTAQLSKQELQYLSRIYEACLAYK
jgi:hypothetical protein